MATRVNIPGVGMVEFPDSMDEQDISAASKKLYQDAVGTNPARAKRQEMRSANPSGTSRELAAKRSEKIRELIGPDSAAGRFQSNAAEGIIGAAAGAKDLALHPIDSISSIASETGEGLGRTGAALAQGNIPRAAGEAIGSLPVIGPAARRRAIQGYEGDVAGAVGGSIGDIAGGALMGRVPGMVRGGAGAVGNAVLSELSKPGYKQIGTGAAQTAGGAAISSILPSPLGYAVGGPMAYQGGRNITRGAKARMEYGKSAGQPPPSGPIGNMPQAPHPMAAQAPHPLAPPQPMRPAPQQEVVGQVPPSSGAGPKPPAAPSKATPGQPANEMSMKQIMEYVVSMGDSPHSERFAPKEGRAPVRFDSGSGPVIDSSKRRIRGEGQPPAANPSMVKPTILKEIASDSPLVNNPKALEIAQALADLMTAEPRKTKVKSK